MPKGRKSTVKKYNAARGNLLQNVRRAERRGAEYDRSTIPEVPEKVTMSDVREMRNLNKSKNRYANETWTSNDTGEQITGTEFRNLSRNEKKEYIPDSVIEQPVANETYIEKVQARLDEAIAWVDAEKNPNYITPYHMQEIEDVWYTSLSYCDTAEATEQFNQFLKMNSGIISKSLDIIQYDSDGNENTVEAQFEFLLDLLEWEPV